MSGHTPLMMRAAVARLVFFLGIWLVIANWSEENLVVGLVASALALWISLSLLPPSAVHLRLVQLARLSFRFLSCSIIAGVDVARRALLPRVDLRPGFAVVPVTLPPGGARNVFLVYQSLQPGTSPIGVEGEMLQVHCLDISQPTAEAIKADETLFKAAICHE
jgi:multicomponent Na+:H+ antiporter subunit E